MRKIIHVDMDAFYASVEQRDNPGLRGRPVVVAWTGPRAVVCAASYEVRPYGVHSAMSAARARRLCPEAVFVAPDFSRYKAVSRQVHAVFARYTDLVEPLSLDEAYLDVTANRAGLSSATATAAAIRADIRAATGLTASAGVAPNKFLAKIASDWRKPDGQFVIAPRHVSRFLLQLEVARIPGVGKVMQQRLAELGVHGVADLQRLPRAQLEQRFGRWGVRLYQLARGIDERPVRNDREPKQVSSETTFATDLPLDALGPAIREQAQEAWDACMRKAGRGSGRVPRTIVLKLKTADFRILTRSLTPGQRPRSAREVGDIASALRERVDHPAGTRYRLVGVGLGGFIDAELDAALQADLFQALADDA